MKRTLFTLGFLLLSVTLALGVEYTDSFPQADENPLSSSGAWTTGYEGTAPKVVSNAVRPGAQNDGDEYASVNSISPANDQFAQVTIRTISAN